MPIRHDVWRHFINNRHQFATVSTANEDLTNSSTSVYYPHKEGEEMAKKKEIEPVIGIPPKYNTDKIRAEIEKKYDWLPIFEPFWGMDKWNAYVRKEMETDAGIERLFACHEALERRLNGRKEKRPSKETKLRDLISRQVYDMGV